MTAFPTPQPTAFTGARWAVILRLLALAVLLAACSRGESDEREVDAGRPAPTVPPGAPADAVRLEVGDDFQSVVDETPPGSTFVIASGIHRLQQVVPRDGDRFIGESGAVLRGSQVLESFEEADGLFVVSGQTQQNEVGGFDFMEEGRERDAYPEELFFDGERLRHVGSVDEVEPGTWFFDYDADRIYLADDPAGHLVETSVTPWAFGGEGVRDVTIENLTLQHYANRAQIGAIHGQDTRSWTVRAVDASYNHGAGIRIGPGWEVSGCKVTHNGQMGMSGNGQQVEDDPIVVRDCEIAHNKQLGYEWTWEGGATKFAKTVGMVFENNWVHSNIGPGPWFDIDNRDAIIRSNLVENNRELGIHYEISYGAQIYWNEVRNNGLHDGAIGAGIFVSNSSGVEVFENLLYGNIHEVFALQNDVGGGEFGPYTVSGLNVHSNDITISEGELGLRVWTDEDEFYTSRDVRFANNTYRLEDPDAPVFYWNNEEIDAESWQDYGLDTDGEFLPAEEGTLPEGAQAFRPAVYGPSPST